MWFTGKGDKGTAGLYGSRDRQSKDSLAFETLGTLDELNSYIGLCASYARESEHNSGKDPFVISDILFDIQHDLFSAQAEIAGSDKRILPTRVDVIENIISGIEKLVKPSRGFVLPGATILSGHIDVARAISRRAERQAVSFNEEAGISSTLLSYMNRLSSILYALARLSVHRANVKEQSPRY